MEGQVKEKIEGVKKAGRRGKTLTLVGIPSRVNSKIADYQKKISYERGKKYNLKTAYVEFLKEKTLASA
jgi:hypothetical protein